MAQTAKTLQLQMNGGGGFISPATCIDDIYYERKDNGTIKRHYLTKGKDDNGNPTPFFPLSVGFKTIDSSQKDDIQISCIHNDVKFPDYLSGTNVPVLKVTSYNLSDFSKHWVLNDNVEIQDTIKNAIKTTIEDEITALNTTIDSYKTTLSNVSSITNLKGADEDNNRIFLTNDEAKNLETAYNAAYTSIQNFPTINGIDNVTGLKPGFVYEMECQEGMAYLYAINGAQFDRNVISFDVVNNLIKQPLEITLAANYTLDQLKALNLPSIMEIASKIIFEDNVMIECSTSTLNKMINTDMIGKMKNCSVINASLTLKDGDENTDVNLCENVHVKGPSSNTLIPVTLVGSNETVENNTIIVDTAGAIPDININGSGNYLHLINVETFSLQGNYNYIEELDIKGIVNIKGDNNVIYNTVINDANHDMRTYNNTNIKNSKLNISDLNNVSIENTIIQDSTIQKKVDNTIPKVGVTIQNTTILNVQTFDVDWSKDTTTTREIDGYFFMGGSYTYKDAVDNKIIINGK